MDKRVPVSYSDPEKQIIYAPSSSGLSSRIPSPDSIASSPSSSPVQPHPWNSALFAVSRSKEQQSSRPKMIYWRAKRRTVIGIIILIVVAVAGIVAGITAGILGRRLANRASASLVSAPPPPENTSPPHMSSLAPPPNNSRVPTQTVLLPAPTIPSPGYVTIPSALTHAFQNAQWIWFNESGSTEVPAGDWAFRKVLPMNANEAIVLITADNAFKLYSNGNLVANNTAWTNINAVTVPLKPGLNTFAVLVTNLAGGKDKGSPAGLLVSAQITYANGSTDMISSDATWRTTAQAPPGFENPSFNDSSWKTAVVVGNGAESWKGFEVPHVDASG